MKQASGALTAIVFLVVFGLLSWGAWAVGTYFLESLQAIDKEIATTIIATVGTALVGIGTVVYNQRISKNREIAEAHRDHKIAVYNSFMEMIVNVLENAKDNQDPELPPDLEKWFYQFTREAIVWSSPGLVQAWRKFRIESVSDSGQVMYLVDEILREIRSDLGNSNYSLKKGELVSLFLSNPDEISRSSLGTTK